MSVSHADRLRPLYAIGTCVYVCVTRRQVTTFVQHWYVSLCLCHTETGYDFCTPLVHGSYVCVSQAHGDRLRLLYTIGTWVLCLCFAGTRKQVTTAVHHRYMGLMSVFRRHTETGYDCCTPSATAYRWEASSLLSSSCSAASESYSNPYDYVCLCVHLRLQPVRLSVCTP